MKNRKKIGLQFTGFTLAEVLITLGIIGIVAALTIPILMSQVQDRQLKAAAKAAYSKTYQAVEMMKHDNSGSLTSYYNSVDSFEPDFQSYLKVAKDCGMNGCVDAGANCPYKTLGGAKGDAWWLLGRQLVTIDGMFFSFYNGQDSGHTGIIYIIADVNGYGKVPNVYGRDVFLFQLKNDKLLPMGALTTDWSADTWCDKNDKINSSQGAGCMYKVISGVDYAY